MINYPFFLLLISFFSLLFLWMGHYTSENQTDAQDYFLSKRKLGTIPLIFTFLATQIGGGTVLGAAEEAYRFGWKVIFYPLGFSLGFLVLSLGYGRKLRNGGLHTIPELFEKSYNSINLRKFSSIISITSLFLILIAVGISAQKFFNSIGLTSPLIYFGFWSVIIFYTVLGGLSAVVWTDLVQMLFIMIAFIFTYLFTDTGLSVSEIIQNATQVTNTHQEVPFINWMIVPFLYMLIEQDMAQRCFAATSAKDVSRSTFISAMLFLICTSLPIYFGLCAKFSNFVSGENASVLMNYVSSVSINPMVTTIFAVSLLIAIISTADSLLCSISSNIVLDFMVKNNSAQSSKKQSYSKWITFLTGIIAMGLSYTTTNIISVMIFSYEFMASVLFIPIVTAVFYDKKTFPKLAAISSITLGGLSFIALEIYPISIPRILVSLVLSAIGLIIGLIFRPR